MTPTAYRLHFLFPRGESWRHQGLMGKFHRTVWIKSALGELPSLTDLHEILPQLLRVSQDC